MNKTRTYTQWDLLTNEGYPVLTDIDLILNDAKDMGLPNCKILLNHKDFIAFSEEALDKSLKKPEELGEVQTTKKGKYSSNLLGYYKGHPIYEGWRSRIEAWKDNEEPEG